MGPLALKIAQAGSIGSPHDPGAPVPWLPLPARGDPPGRALVPPLLRQPARPGGDAGRPRRSRGPRLAAPLGAALRAGARAAVAPAPAGDRAYLAHRRDLHPRRRRLAVPLPSRRRRGEDDRVPAQPRAGRGRHPALLRARPRARPGARAPRVVVTDGLASYRTTLGDLARDGRLREATRHRRGRWLDNRVEQDHRRIKRRTRPMLGLKRFATARRALAGIEAMAMLAKGRRAAWVQRTPPRSVPSCTSSSASPPERERAGSPLHPTEANATEPRGALPRGAGAAAGATAPPLRFRAAPGGGPGRRRSPAPRPPSGSATGSATRPGAAPSSPPPARARPSRCRGS
jgi:DDE superfamily endonuclease